MEVVILVNVTNTIFISVQPKFNVEYIFGSIKGSIYLLCSIFSVILNLPLIINWIFNCKKDNYADFLLISITVADFLGGLLVCPINCIKEFIEMNLISSNVISKKMFYISLSIDNSIWLISPLSLLLLSLHRYKQLTSPFKERVELNRFRILIIVSIWFLSSIIGFLIIWYILFIKYEEYIEILYHFIQCAVIISTISLNILIIYKFKSKLKNTKLNKNSFKNEKKAILCSVWLNILLLITCAPFLILQPFAIYNFQFVYALHGIYYSFNYFYIIVDPLILLLFNKNLRLDVKSIYRKFKARSQTIYPQACELDV